ncbi:hypothetical protein KZ829_21520 [Actinoplanes hulinensis]|uniref:Uncharacterized protein n=1 Tax=Actinoplanes hulinensis TaxID=1144547 RepID=A0ABS7B5J9_9ACTN|nr:hypothetical protein [Actinoplanes hulinensis]MBW6436322.1 hypothetical protein [Actinoplanes hulinensis]
MPAETTYLELSEDSGSSHKFYEVTVDGADLDPRRWPNHGGVCPVASRITDETAEWLADVVDFVASERNSPPRESTSS